MKIIRDKQDTLPLEDWADLNGLTLRILKRQAGEERGAYFADFPGVGLPRARYVEDVFGEGDSELDAVVAFAEAISGQNVVIEGEGGTEARMRCPILTVTHKTLGHEEEG